MSDETMAVKVIENVNFRLEFLFWKNWFADVPLR